MNSLKRSFKCIPSDFTQCLYPAATIKPPPAVFVFPGKATANTETKWTSSTDSCPCFCSPGLILPHYFQPKQFCYISRQELHIKIMFDITRKKKKIRHMQEVFNSCWAIRSLDRNAHFSSEVPHKKNKKQQWGKDFLLVRVTASSGNSLCIGLQRASSSLLPVLIQLKFHSSPFNLQVCRRKPYQGHHFWMWPVGPIIRIKHGDSVPPILSDHHLAS